MGENYLSEAVKKKKKYGLRSCSDLGSATKQQSGSDCEPVSAEPEPRGGTKWLNLQLNLSSEGPSCGRIRG